MSNLKRSRIPELMAPAGSEETFFAAVDAQADAVYLGLNQFNARIRADNFSFRQLETLIPFAHAQKVKVYITLNTLIKQIELANLIHTLSRLEQLKPDALIVQDYGVAMLAMAHAPSIPLHASTQMTVLNSAGATLFKNLGFSRVILARECTLDEIIAIGKKSGMELEVFAHGALCYSYSGQCYFSSYHGGASANRGRCTQPCRRSYKSPKGEGAFFSPRDLCLIDRIPELIKSDVAAIKIEGRLKSESYITRVVSAYRSAIDSAPNPPSQRIIQDATEDYGRPKSRGYFEPDGEHPLINPQHTAGTGRFLGKVSAADAKRFSFFSPARLEKGDRLRVTQKFEGEAVGFILDSFSAKPGNQKGNKGFHYSIPNKKQAKPGDLVFLIGHKSQSPTKPLLALEPEYRNRPNRQKNPSPSVQDAIQEISKELASASSTVRQPPKQLIRVALPPGARDIIRLIDNKADEYIVPLKHRELFSLPRGLRNKVVLRIPVFIHERELQTIKRRLRDSISKGFTRFLIGNPSHIQILSEFPEARMQSDYTFGVLNTAAVLALARLGVEMVTVSLENDIPNLTELSGKARGFPLELVCYGRPPLFTSRTRPPLPKNRAGTEVQRHSDSFLVEPFEKLTIVTPKTPFSLTGPVKKHIAQKFSALRLELSAFELQKKHYDILRSSIRKWAPIRGTRPFNYRPKAGIQ